MNACSIDVKDMLVADGSLNLIYASNLFIAKEPIEPNNTVTIFDISGRPPANTLKKGYEYFYGMVQIRVRGSDYTTAFALANLIMNSLHGRDHETWNDTLYTAIFCTNGPAMLGWDDNRRVIIVTNYELQHH